MKTILLFFLFFVFTSSTTDHANLEKPHLPASSILYINNYTAKNITGVTIVKSSGSTYISTFITPFGSQEINLGNTSENITVITHLSGAISGSIQVNEIDPFYCPWLACGTFTNLSMPSLGFYMYSPRWLYVLQNQACFC